MIDAATIGITLALQDGVSGGIAAIAAQLVALDRAVDASTARLGRLGESLHATQLSVLTHPPGDAAALMPPAPGTRAAPSADPMEDPAASVTPAATPIAPAPALATTNAVAPVAGAARPAAPIALPTALAPGPQTQVPPAGFASFAPRAPVAPGFTAETAPAFALPLSGAPGGDARAPLAPTVPAFISAPLVPSAAIAPALPASVRAPAAPMPLPSSPIVAAPPPSAAAPPAPLSVSQTDSRNNDGRVLLDGFALGRWMSDRLDRAATRPPAAATGFDPRLSPAWPGQGTGY